MIESNFYLPALKRRIRSQAIIFYILGIIQLIFSLFTYSLIFLVLGLIYSIYLIVTGSIGMQAYRRNSIVTARSFRCSLISLIVVSAVLEVIYTFILILTGYILIIFYIINIIFCLLIAVLALKVANAYLITLA